MEIPILLGKLGKDMKTFVEQYGYNHFSQNGEDGVITETIARIGMKQGICCEFGSHDGTYCSNTANLIVNGWRGKMIEGDEMLFNQLINNRILPEDLDCENAFVTPENVNRLVPKGTNVLSIDIDGNDYEVWRAYKAKPAIVIIEINSSFHPDERHFSKELGCSYTQMVELGEMKGYFLLCHTGNLIFVDDFYRKYFPEVKGSPIENHVEYFKTDWL